MLEHLSTFFATVDGRIGVESARAGLPRYVRRELVGIVDCGVLSRGFVRVYCSDCRQSILVAYSPGSTWRLFLPIPLASRQAATVFQLPERDVMIKPVLLGAQ